jgi:lysophospholipase L1-like esterase
MKKIILALILTGMVLFHACEPDQPAAPVMNISQSELALSKMVAIGNSLTAGFQSSGLSQSFQLNSYPYLIAQQMGKSEFEQPIIEEPGIGVPSGLTPMYFDPGTGEIKQDTLTKAPEFMLLNLTLPRPYDNLGVPGADLNDLLNTRYGSESGDNSFFDIVLRNPNLGITTQLEQAVLLQPSLVLLWAGNNDVLAAAVQGGDLSLITSQTDFEDRMEAIIVHLRTELPGRLLIMANIPYVTDIPYVNTLDGIIVGGTPMVFDDSLQVIDFGGQPLPLAIAEKTSIDHVTLVGLNAYQSGIGVPDSAYMVDVFGLAPGQAGVIQGFMIAGGLTPTGIEMDSSMTITTAQASTIKDDVDGFNTTIASLAQTYQVPVIDANAILTVLNTSGINGASGKYVLIDPATTAFSLDGIHLNNAGNAIAANAFIGMINTILQLDPGIPEVNVSEKLGQYIPAPPKLVVSKAIKNAGKIFLADTNK